MLGECVGFSEFGEFEYSPKCPFSPFCPDSIHSPDIRHPFCPDSTHSPDIRQPLSPDSIHSPDIRQPFSPDSTHSTLDTFADIRQNETRIRHIRTSNSPFRRIWREWPLLNTNSLGIKSFIKKVLTFKWHTTFTWECKGRELLGPSLVRFTHSTGTLTLSLYTPLFEVGVPLSGQ